MRRREGERVGEDVEMFDLLWGYEDRLMSVQDVSSLSSPFAPFAESHFDGLVSSQ